MKSNSITFFTTFISCIFSVVLSLKYHIFIFLPIPFYIIFLASIIINSISKAFFTLLKFIVIFCLTHWEVRKFFLTLNFPFGLQYEFAVIHFLFLFWILYEKKKPYLISSTISNFFFNGFPLSIVLLFIKLRTHYYNYFWQIVCVEFARKFWIHSLLINLILMKKSNNDQSILKHSFILLTSFIISSLVILIITGLYTIHYEKVISRISSSFLSLLLKNFYWLLWCIFSFGVLIYCYIKSRLSIQINY